MRRQRPIQIDTRVFTGDGGFAHACMNVLYIKQETSCFFASLPSAFRPKRDQQRQNKAGFINAERACGVVPSLLPYGMRAPTVRFNRFHCRAVKKA